MNPLYNGGPQNQPAVRHNLVELDKHCASRSDCVHGFRRPGDQHLGRQEGDGAASTPIVPVNQVDESATSVFAVTYRKFFPDAQKRKRKTKTERKKKRACPRYVSALPAAPETSLAQLKPSMPMLAVDSFFASNLTKAHTLAMMPSSSMVTILVRTVIESPWAHGFRISQTSKPRKSAHISQQRPQHGTR